MSNSILRTVIIYVILIFFVRAMGKRQLGELQPGELVVTILVSEIAANPITDTSAPLLSGILPLMVIVSLEIISSFISMKSVKFRYMSEGNTIAVIKNGELDQKQMKELRFTINDILSALRQKDIFDIRDVQYAVVETNGTLSVLPKENKRTLTPDSLNNKKEDTVPTPVIIDGKFLNENFKECGTNQKEIEKRLTASRLTAEEILLMTADRKRDFHIIKKEN